MQRVASFQDMQKIVCSDMLHHTNFCGNIVSWLPWKGIQTQSKLALINSKALTQGIYRGKSSEKIVQCNISLELSRREDEPPFSAREFVTVSEALSSNCWRM